MSPLRSTEFTKFRKLYVCTPVSLPPTSSGRTGRMSRRDVLCEIQGVLDVLRRNARFATVAQSSAMGEVKISTAV